VVALGDWRDTVTDGDHDLDPVAVDVFDGVGGGVMVRVVVGVFDCDAEIVAALSVASAENDDVGVVDPPEEEDDIEGVNEAAGVTVLDSVGALRVSDADHARLEDVEFDTDNVSEDVPL
jgi:hypothetical protein